MKKFKKLIPAFCMLLVSAILLGSSTYAWFSMNKTVAATGLQMTAKADFMYLLAVEKDADKAKDANTAFGTMQANPSTYKSVEFNMSGVNTALAPSTPDAAASTTNRSKTTLAVEGNWYTTSSDDPGSPNASAKPDAKHSLGTAGYDFANYVIKKTVYLTLAKDSTGTILKASATITKKGADETDVISAVKVLVAGTKGVAEGSTVAEIADITNTAAVEVDVYVYFDGTDSSVYTNNFANIMEGATIVITFSVE